MFLFLLWVYRRILLIPTLDLHNYLSVIRGLRCNISFFLLSVPVPHCLSDVQLIPPCDRILLEMTYSDLYKWAIKELRAAIMQSDMKFKSRGINPAIPPVDNSKVSKFTYIYSLKEISVSRRNWSCHSHCHCHRPQVWNC